MLADHFIGQSAAITQLQTAIDACKQRGTILPHALLIAPPGVGKTRLAMRIADEMNAPYADLALPATQRDLAVRMVYHRGILLLDEIHQANRKTLDSLLPFLVDGKIRYGRLMQENTRLTIIAATTDPQNLPDAFRSRFRLQPTFAEYTAEEIAAIIQYTASDEHQLDLDAQMCERLGNASLGNPRQAIALLNTYIDLRALHEDVQVEDVLRHLGFTSEGLRPDHLQYLQALKTQGGAASQQTLAQILFMPSASLRWVERDLLRLGLIAISSLGRELRRMDWETEANQVASAQADNGPNVNPYTLEPRT